MRLPRLYVDRPLVPGASLDLPDAAARHLVQVLRVAVGAPLLVFNGDGRDYAARVTRAGRQGAALAIESAGGEEPHPPLAIRLALGISKGDRMDYAIQKSVELGVAAIAPLFTQRSVVQLQGERLTRRMEHWQGIVTGACEQSGRRRLPRLEPAAALAEWLAESLAEVGAGGLLLDPEAPQALAALPPPPGPVTLLVGPEGGLSPGERDLARTHGFRGVRLGPRILRTETAPLAAIAVIQALWGDLA